MPSCHRNTDVRFCGAFTIVTHQTTVFVNGLLWSVMGDWDDHCPPNGALIAVYPPRNVFINGINVICAIGDTAMPDFLVCFLFHPPASTSPASGSPNTFVYPGAGGA